MLMRPLTLRVGGGIVGVNAVATGVFLADQLIRGNQSIWQSFIQSVNQLTLLDLRAFVTRKMLVRVRRTDL